MPFKPRVKVDDILSVSIGVLPLLSVSPVSLKGTLSSSTTRLPGFAAELGNALAAASSGSPAATLGDTSRIEDTGRQIEALLLNQLLKQMWAAIPKSTLLPAGSEGQFYREMWLEAVAEEMATHNGGIGIGKIVADQLKEQASRTITPAELALRV